MKPSYARPLADAVDRHFVEGRQLPQIAPGFLLRDALWVALVLPCSPFPWGKTWSCVAEHHVLSRDIYKAWCFKVTLILDGSARCWVENPGKYNKKWLMICIISSKSEVWRKNKVTCWLLVQPSGLVEHTWHEMILLYDFSICSVYFVFVPGLKGCSASLHSWLGFWPWTLYLSPATGRVAKLWVKIVKIQSPNAFEKTQPLRAWGFWAVQCQIPRQYTAILEISKKLRRWSKQNTATAATDSLCRAKV